MSDTKFLSGTKANENKIIKIIIFVCNEFWSKINFDSMRHMALNNLPHMEFIDAKVARSEEEDFS